jgi:hypothetical protein
LGLKSRDSHVPSALLLLQLMLKCLVRLLLGNFSTLVMSQLFMQPLLQLLLKCLMRLLVGGFSVPATSQLLL